MKQLISRIWAIKKRLLASILLIVFLGLNWLWMDFRDFMTTPLDLSQYQQTFVIKKGASIHALAKQLYQDKVIKRQNYLKLLAYWYPEYQKLKAGEYAIIDQLTPVELLQQLTRGLVVQYPFTIIEGQTIYQVLDNLKNTQDILIKLNVINQANALFIDISNFFHILCIISANPCKNPQNINVHPAPCQRPPNIKVAIRFLYISNSPPLLPPRGM